METTPPGHHGPHVRPHVVSALENVTEHVPTLSQCSEGDRVRSRAWVYQVKLSIATCDSVQVWCSYLAYGAGILTSSASDLWPLGKFRSSTSVYWVFIACMVLSFSLIYSEEILKYFLLRDLSLQKPSPNRRSSTNGIKQLLDEAFVINQAREKWPWLRKLTETLIIPDIAKFESNNCLLLIVLKKITMNTPTIAQNTDWHCSLEIALYARNLQIHCSVIC